MPPSPSTLSAVLGNSAAHKAPYRSFRWALRATWLCRECSARRISMQRRKSKDFRLTSTQKQTDFFRERIYKPTVPLTIHCRRFSAHAGNEASKGRDDLPSQKESRRSHVAKRFSHVMDHLQSNIFIAGQRLNDLTGYSGIEALKRDIEAQEEQVQSTRKDLQAARAAYSTAISQRSGSQREVNELLQRKHAWSPNDLERFTTLYRSDHANEQTESVAQANLVAAERKAEEVAARLSASILARYHEEQIWSDKIRRMSTWGTWGLMGVNILLFVVFQIGVEPWRRRRLVKGFEEKVMEALEREGSGPAQSLEVAQSPSNSANPPTLPTAEETTIVQEAEPDIAFLADNKDLSNETVVHLKTQDSVLDEVQGPMSGVQRLQSAVHNLFSHRQVVKRQIDITTLALEGVAAGMVMTVGLFLLIQPR